jgi:hypothetical protein
MEMSQRNSLYSYLKQTKVFFFFLLLQNQRTGSVWGAGISGKGEDVGKGEFSYDIL